MDEPWTSKVSRVLVTGNAAALSRLAVFEASRAASSASIRVRSSSSGVQRCVLAVSITVAALARMVDSFSRRSPAVRSAGSSGTTGAAGGVDWWSSWGDPRSGRAGVTGDGGQVVGVQRSGCGDGQVHDQGSAGWHGGGRRGAGGQDGADVCCSEPCERHRPAQRRDQLVAAVGGAQGQQNVQFGAQAGVADGGGADQERLRRCAQRAELSLRGGSRPGARDGAGRGPS